MLNNIKIKRKESGFTIVELLIVIVIIGILAAITIVSYNGITKRANTASAQSTANAVISKAEVYLADGPTAKYPSTLATLTGAGSDTTYRLTGATYNALPGPGAPTSPSMVDYQLCGTSATTAAPTSYATIVSATGVIVRYWDYSANSAVSSPAGQTTGASNGNSIACFTSGS